MRTDEVIEIFGSCAAVARAIGLTRSAVEKWGVEVPKSRRDHLRLAMKRRADELEQEARMLRAKAKAEEVRQ